MVWSLTADFAGLCAMPRDLTSFSGDYLYATHRDRATTFSSGVEQGDYRNAEKSGEQAEYGSKR